MEWHALSYVGEMCPTLTIEPNLLLTSKFGFEDGTI